MTQQINRHLQSLGSLSYSSFLSFMPVFWNSFGQTDSYAIEINLLIQVWERMREQPQREREMLHLKMRQGFFFTGLSGDIIV